MISSLLALLGRPAAAVAAALAITLAAAVPAWALDRVTLKSGEVLEGDIERETPDGMLVMRVRFGGLESLKFIDADDIAEIERDVESDDGAAGENATTTNARPAAASPRSERTPGVPRGAVITLEGTVGIQMAAITLERILPLLEEDLGDDGTGIVVFKINSGGGLLLEIQRLSDIIHNRYKDKFRVVTWIESAISAAAMTSHAVEEIYFMPEGNYGACTGYSGALVGMEGMGLLSVLETMERISARGGYDYRIMRSMQVDEPLSATIMPNGEVQWFNTTDGGEFLVNAPGDILTFNSRNAEQFGFSRGTAATLDDLTRAMGLTEVEWVGQQRSGFLYPISRAEEEMMEFRERTTEDQERLGERMSNYQNAISAAESMPAGPQRGPFIGRARSHLRVIERMMENNPNFALLNFGMTLEQWRDTWLRQQEERIDDLLSGTGGGNNRQPGGGGGVTAPG